MDLDNVFKYASPKYVYIRDAKLGILKYILMALIFFYVVIYDIFIENSHLKPHHASGYGHIQVVQPQDECDDDFDNSCLAKFDTIDTLPYCQQYISTTTTTSTSTTTTRKSTTTTTGKKKKHAAHHGKHDKKNKLRRMRGEREPEDDYDDEEEIAQNADEEEDGRRLSESTSDAEVGDMLSKKRMCRYFDNMRMAWVPSQPSEIFIPTRYRRVHQKYSTNCYDPVTLSETDSFSCDQPWVTDSVHDFYVADIGEFSLIFTHSFNSASSGMSGTSVDYQGFFAACTTNKPMKPAEIRENCKVMKVPNTTGQVVPEDLKGLTTAEEEGVPSLRGKNSADEIQLKDLLKLTPVAQQNNIKSWILDRKLPDSFGHPKESLREKGGMLMIDVDYANTGPYRPGLPLFPKGMQIKPITYIYRPYFIPTNENMKYQLVQSGDDPNERVVDIWYGLTIKMQFNGQLVKFTFAKLLSGLTTGLVLITAATSIVIALASYVLPLKEKYSLLMYQLSEDFSDYKHCKEKSPADAASMFWVGQLLWDKCKEKEGTQGRKISPEEMLGILCTTEMRLNRLDGMDPKMVFAEGEEMDARNYKIGDEAAKFYSRRQCNLKAMSYRLQGESRQRFESSSQSLGKLKGN